ncbi:MAG: hypothetical protein ACYCSI_15865, partial [Solirubrobacteraceae bacterium]
MFLLTQILYPGVLLLLCAGAGLLVSRGSGGTLPRALLLPVGAAALIGFSQLTTMSATLAPATPFLVAALALAGFVLAKRELLAIGSSLRQRRAPLLLTGGFLLTYLFAIAPVFFLGRPSLSAYMTLTDSAYHILGSSYLIEHGRAFGGVSTGSSYGIVLHSYFDSGYPTGADTFFGASSALLRLSALWTFQPFNAFALALAVGPASMLARRAGLAPALATLAALTTALPALVYAYELIGSVKEIVTLPLLLAIGALLLDHRRWLASARGCLPIAIVAAAGVSTEGIGFGAWLLVAAALLAIVWARLIVAERASGGRALGARVLPTLAFGAVAIAVLAWPTWEHLGSSLAVTRAIAKTSEPGNLQAPLQPVQLLGTWLTGNYMASPIGTALTITEICAGLTAFAALLGTLFLLATRRLLLAAWLIGMVAVWVALTAYSTTWVDAKGLVLTSPSVVLLAWAGVAALLRAPASARAGGRLRATASGEPSRQSSLAGAVAGVASFVAAPARALSLALAGAIAFGVLASDAYEYHSTNLAPTARYEQLAALGSRFAGQGPTLFTDFDEYSLYVLRALQVSGPV